MTTKLGEFPFDFADPTACLAYTQSPRLAAERGAAAFWRPMRPGAVFRGAGNAGPVGVAAKGCWARRDGVPFAQVPQVPISPWTLVRGAMNLQTRKASEIARNGDVMFAAMGRRGRNVGDAVTLADAGFDAEAVMARVDDSEVKARLVANTDAMLFGPDRLEFVREALAG